MTDTCLNYCWRELCFFPLIAIVSSLFVKCHFCEIEENQDPGYEFNHSLACSFGFFCVCVVLGSIGTARREKKGTILVSDRKHTASASVSRYFLFSLILFPPPFFTLLRSPLFFVPALVHRPVYDPRSFHARRVCRTVFWINHLSLLLAVFLCGHWRCLCMAA